jgi:outer membrane protein OmpA-like peptidoglycan-associated protein
VRQARQLARLALVLGLATGGSVGCRPTPAPQIPQGRRLHQASRPPRPADPDLVALLPDPDTGHTGRAIVSTPLSNVELTSAGDHTFIEAGHPPTPAAPLGAPDLERLFGRTLAALPRASQHFTLYFRFESEVLTDDSRAALQDVLREVSNHPAPEVVVIGHTDTTGHGTSNVALGLRRATMVRKLLIDVGLDPTAIEVASHGEADPLVTTADNVAEARNRRVEITVR